MAKRKATKAKAKSRSKAKRAPAKKRVAKKTASRPKVKAKPKAKAKAKAKPASRPKVSVGHPAGTFCWAELSTSSLSGADAFYSSLLGWKITQSDLPGGSGLYGMAHVSGKSVAGMRELGKDEPTPPNWGL